GFEPPLGNGPYRVAKVDAGRSVAFERVKDWWGKDLPVSRGLYNFDSLTVNYYGDTEIARQLLQAGTFDYNREFSSSGFVVGYSGPAIDDGRLQKNIFAQKRPVAAQGFVFNLDNPIFKDRRVREALSLLWDFDWINRRVMRNFYVREQSYFPKSDMAATELPTPAELKILEPLRAQVPDEVFTTVYQPPKTDGSGYIRDKQLQALKLLAEAGWHPKDNKLVNAAGEPMVFSFLDGQGGFDRLILPFKRTLAQIGITLDFLRIDSAQYINRLNARDYDMIVVNLPKNGNPIISPGRELYNLFGSQSATEVGSSNAMVLRNPAVDTLIDGLVSANTRNDMVTYARALDRVLQWGYYMIPNYYSKGTPLVFANRFGMPAVAPIYDVGLETWWQISPTPLTNAQAAALAGKTTAAKEH
ncbi:extracellular solute-binding protein, partial [Pseudomonas syringae]